ncbi:MAG: SgcJ/EcaC family oxidoreductase [Bryobacteraceae bacterium]
MRLVNAWSCAFALTSMMTLAGCQTAPQPEPKSDTAADIRAIGALRDKVSAAYNSGDANALAAAYTDDVIVMNANQPAVEGKQAVRAMFETLFKENAVKLVITPLETQVAGDWAYDRGNYALTITPKSGKRIEESGKYLVICKRQPDGSWKLSRDIGNSSEPLPAAAPKKK